MSLDTSLRTFPATPAQPHRVERARRTAIATGVICSLLLVAQYAFNQWVPTSDFAGWNGWADQGSYLKSTIDFARLAFDPAEHRYPPLYSLLAVPFLGLNPRDPFIFVNIVSVCVSAYLIVRIFSQVAHPMLAGAFATALLTLEPMIAYAYVVPWTSTIVSPLAIGCIFMLQQAEQQQPPPVASFFFGALIGLTFLARPLDGVILGAAVLPFWGWRMPRSWQALLRHGLALAAGGLIGPCLFFANNFLIFGSPISPYMVETNDRLRFADIPEKFVSLFLDSAALYFEPGQTILQFFPWFIASLAIATSLVLIGKGWVRATAILIFLMISTYLAFDDLLPNGLIRFSNYHYFKWIIVLGGMLTLPFIDCIRERTTWKLACASASFAGIALVGCVHLETSATTVPVSQNGDDFKIDISGLGVVDFIDISRVRGDWLQNYFFGDRVSVDNTPLLYSRQVKTIPGSTFPTPLDGRDKSNARILFIRPIHAQTLLLSLKRLQPSESSGIRAGSYRFSLGFPRWLQ